MFGIYWDLFRRLQSGVVCCVAPKFSTSQMTVQSSVKVGTSSNLQSFFYINFKFQQFYFCFLESFYFFKKWNYIWITLGIQNSFGITDWTRQNKFLVSTDLHQVGLNVLNKQHALPYLCHIINCMGMDNGYENIFRGWDMRIGWKYDWNFPFRTRHHVWTQWPSTVISDGQLFYFCLIRRKI